MASLNVNDLSNQISEKIMQSASDASPDALATGINSALTNWFRANLFPLMVGVSVFITVLFVFYGSFLYFTAYGDENRATQAKKTITYAFVGFFIAAVALGIANYSKRILIRNQYEADMLQGTSGTGAGQGAAGGGQTNTGFTSDPNITAPDEEAEKVYQALPGKQ